MRSYRFDPLPSIIACGFKEGTLEWGNLWQNTSNELDYSIPDYARGTQDLITKEQHFFDMPADTWPNSSNEKTLARRARQLAQVAGVKKLF